MLPPRGRTAARCGTRGTGGGILVNYPLVNSQWIGSKVGDFWLGAKINLTSQWRQQPAAFALRGMIKGPTAKTSNEGVGTGKPDVAIDAIGLRWLSPIIKLGAILGLSSVILVSLLGQGLKNREIAERLGIAEKTIKGHLTNIFLKLGVQDRLELALLAIRTHLAPTRRDPT